MMYMHRLSHRLACASASAAALHLHLHTRPEQGQFTYSAAPSSKEAEVRAKLKAAQPALDQIFQHHLDQYHIPSLIYAVTLHGEVVFHGSLGNVSVSPSSPSTRSGNPPSFDSSKFRIASMTKSFTAMAIIQLRDKGLLQLSDPVSKYVPEVEHMVPLTADCPVLTVGHLLTMQGGLPQDDPWGDRLLDMSDHDFSKLLTSGLYFSNPIGTVYEYSNLGYSILGLVIKNITKMPYQDYITKHILHPLGMRNSYFECDKAGIDLVQGYRWEDKQWKEEPMLHDGAFGAMGGIITTMEDFSKYMAFHQAAWPASSEKETRLLEGNSSTGPPLLCWASLREMHFPWAGDSIFLEKSNLEKSSSRSIPVAAASTLTPSAHAKTSLFAGVWSEAYGYGLKSCRDLSGARWIRHAGGLPGFSSEWRFLPEYGIGLAVFSNRTYCSTGEANHAAMVHLLRECKIAPSPRNVDVLSIRSFQLLNCLRNGFDDLTSGEIFSSNFYLDKPQRLWLEETEQIRKILNDMESVSRVLPENNLRGTFVVTGKSGSKVKVYFTLTPENPPRIQTLKLNILPSA